jgi:hypothetical protein
MSYIFKSSPSKSTFEHTGKVIDFSSEFQFELFQPTYQFVVLSEVESKTTYQFTPPVLNFLVDLEYNTFAVLKPTLQFISKDVVAEVVQVNPQKWSDS